MSNPKMIDVVISGVGLYNLETRKSFSEEQKQLWINLIYDITRYYIDHIAKRTKYPIKISQLYNAFTEKTQLAEIRDLNKKYGFDNIYADSGGLQMITRSKDFKNLSDKDYNKVYDAQQHADFAFCFDEIPVKTDDSKANRTNSDGIYFDSDRLIPCAQKTARNICNQIEYFDKLGTDTKVFYICQGNSIDDYVRWFEQGLAILEPKHWERIQGISLSAKCLGTGTHSDIIELAACRKIYDTFDKKYLGEQIHLLGIGSVPRLIPIFILIKSGFLPFVDISFDSTAIAVLYNYGRYFGTCGKIIKTKNNLYDIKSQFIDTIDMVEHIFKNYGIMDIYSHIDLFVDVLQRRLRIYNVENERERFLIRLLKIVYIHGSFKNYLSAFSDLEKLVPKNASPISHLHDVATFDDFLQWDKHYGVKLDSKYVPNINSKSTLDNFFS